MLFNSDILCSPIIKINKNMSNSFPPATPIFFITNTDFKMCDLISKKIKKYIVTLNIQNKILAVYESKSNL